MAGKIPAFKAALSTILRPKKTPEQSPGAFTNKQKKLNYFFVESINFWAESTVVLEESVTTVVTLSVFTTVVESVVADEDPDPQAAKTLTANTVNNFFILMS